MILSISNIAIVKLWYQYFLAHRDLCPPSPDDFFYDWPIRVLHRCCVSGCYWSVLVRLCPDYFEKPCQPAAENPSSGTRTRRTLRRDSQLRAGPPSRRLRNDSVDALQFDNRAAKLFSTRVLHRKVHLE